MRAGEEGEKRSLEATCLGQSPSWPRLSKLSRLPGRGPSRPEAKDRELASLFLSLLVELDTYTEADILLPSFREDRLPLTHRQTTPSTFPTTIYFFYILTFGPALQGPVSGTLRPSLPAQLALLPW